MPAPTVEEVYGEQIRVAGQWYHAERIFGRKASNYRPGDLVPQIAQGTPRAAHQPPDEWLAPDLFRESGANITPHADVERYLQAMIEYGGWGAFPPVSGRVEEVTLDDIERCASLVAQREEHIWTGELAWSRTITQADLGRRYLHIEEGHRRMHAASRLLAMGYAVQAAVFDFNFQERVGESERFA